MLNRTSGVSIFQHPMFGAILIFFLSMGINLIGIDRLSLTSDECFSIYHAQMSPRLIYHHLSTGNNPPLYEWILHFWIGWFGDSAFSVRFLSLIFSSLTTAALFILGLQMAATDSSSAERKRNLRLGILAATFFLASNYSTFLAHEARTYNLTLFLGVLSTICFIMAIQSNQTKHFLVYGMIGGLLCLSHFFGLWILLAHGSFWVLSQWRNPKLLQRLGWALLGFGIAFGWYIPNLWYRFVDSASQGTWVNPAPWDAPYLTLWKYLNTPAATVLAIMLLVYAVVMVVAHHKIRSAVHKQSAQLLLWLFALPFCGQWLLSLDHPFSIPMFTERYACITLPFLCLILAMSLSGLREHFNPWLYNVVLPLFLFTILSAKLFTPPNQACVKEALQKTAKELANSSIKNTPIILEPYHAAFQALYYADHQRFQQYHPEDIYKHLAHQLSYSNIWILNTSKSLDSLGLSQQKSLAYLHFGLEKSNHTKMIESQLFALTIHGGKSRIEHIQLPKSLWGTFKISHEAKFWLIEKN